MRISFIAVSLLILCISSGWAQDTSSKGSGDSYGDYGKKPSYDKGYDKGYDKPKCESKCRFPRVWSDKYEGGACICPTPFAPEATQNTTVIVDGVPVTETVIVSAPLSCPPNQVWDVVACRCIPDCPEGFDFDGIQGRCLCEVYVDCKAKCKEKYTGKGDYSKKDYDDCDREVFDASSCKCVKECRSDNVNCVFGTHFDSKQCKCVRNKCKTNFACPRGSHFDSNVCVCVPHGCDKKERRVRCSFGFHFDETVCTCVPNRCPDYVRCCDGLVPDPNAACNCTNCTAQACPSTRTWSTSTCSCVCNPITCINGTQNPNTCACDCGISRVLASNGTCVCAPGRVLNATTGACDCVPVECADTITGQPTVQNLTTCACACANTTACPAPFTRNPATCECDCNATVCNGGVVNTTTCACECAPLPDQILINSTCFDTCPGIADCPPGAVLNTTICVCQWNCSALPGCNLVKERECKFDKTCNYGDPKCDHKKSCHYVQGVRDPLEACKCVAPCPNWDRPCPAGSFRILEDCNCHAICGNHCPFGRQPDYLNACICPVVNVTCPVYPDRPYRQKIYQHPYLDIDLEPPKRYGGKPGYGDKPSYGGKPGYGDYAQSEDYGSGYGQQQYQSDYQSDYGKQSGGHGGHGGHSGYY